MFKQLLALLRKDDLVSQALRNTNEMLEKAGLLYKTAVDVLTRGIKPSFDLYTVDQEINSLEKKIRRKVLEHLSFNPQQDIVASLVLTSIIIDIERIGDYSKNIYELTELKSRAKEATLDPELSQKAVETASEFGEISAAMDTGDDEEARNIMERLNPIKKSYDDYIKSMATANKETQCLTVVNTLFARYLKRVTAHLENIASSIANPFDQIGFYPDQPGKEAD
jgi:phosphate uptake regulator